MFVKNNIEFRHTSSERFAEFYKMRGSLLGQVLSTKRFKFSTASREVILQNFSVWTTFLQKAEIELVKSGEYVTSTAGTNMSAAFKSASQELLNIITVNPNVFPKPYTRLYSKIMCMEHSGLHTVLRKHIEADPHCKVPIVDYFTVLCDLLKSYMNHTLFTVHEIDNVLNSVERDFISIDRFDLNLKAQGINSPVFRFKTYRELSSFGVEITLKDYADSELSQSEKVFKAECIRKLVVAGASIIQTQ